MNKFFSSPISDDAFNTLAIQYLADELGLDHIDAFLRLVTDSVERREAFATLAWQMRLLKVYPWDGAETASEAIADTLPQPSDRLANSGSELRSISHEHKTWFGAATRAGEQPSAPATGLPRVISPRSVMLSITAAAVVFYGCFLTISWNLRQMGRSSSPIAKVVAEADSTWLSPRLEVGNELRPNGQSQPHSLATGTVEIQLAQGTRLAIEGPAKWTIDDANAATLHSGRLVARVPQQAIGFTIRTSTTKIIDLGTKFGVEVDADGQTNVQVLKGAVNVDYSSIDDQAKPLRRSVRMTAGSAKRFSAQPEDANTVTASEIAPWLDKTASSTKPIAQRRDLPAETKYSAAVMADRPLGYWRFSDTDGHRAVDASGHGSHGEYVGFVSTSNPGICPKTSDRSIRFLGKSYAGHVQMKDFEFPASFTVELWARSATPTWTVGGGWLFSCTRPNGLQIWPTAGWREWSVVIQNTRNGAPSLGVHPGPSDITDRFHQYVVSYDALADRGLMYCDGTLVREKAKMFGDDLPHQAARSTFYVGRVDPRVPNELWGEGFVDELAIYGEVLSPDAVKRHFEAAGYSAVDDSKR